MKLIKHKSRIVKADFEVWDLFMLNLNYRAILSVLCFNILIYVHYLVLVPHTLKLVPKLHLYFAFGLNTFETLSNCTQAREGVIIEWPLNGQFHDRRDVILTSQMAVSNIFLTVAVI